MTDIQTTAYIDIEKVIDSFNYKKDLELDFSTDKKLKLQKLDSLESEIRNFFANLENKKNKSNNDQVGKYNEKVENYRLIKQKMEDQLTEKAQEINLQIKKRLNDYLKKFGDQHNYTLIYGWNNSSSLMYAKSDCDITKEIILYINKEYEGK